MTVVAGERHPDARARVLHLLPDLQVGGGQTVVLTQLRATNRERFVVRTAALDARGPVGADLEAASGSPVVDLGQRGPVGTPIAVKRLAERLRADHVDLLHVHSDRDRKVGQLAALFTGVPVVGHLHAEWVHLGAMSPARSSALARLRAKTFGRLRDGVERRTVRHYVATSDHVRDVFRPLVSQPITVLDQSISADRFVADPDRRAEQRVALGITHEAPVLVCVARLVDGKGHDVLLRTVRDLLAERPELTLLLVGDGPRRADLESTASALGIGHAIRFLGERADVADVLAAADVFVFASENEGFGLAVLEGMAASLPVVAVYCEALAEFVEPGSTGALTPRGDEAAFTAAVDDLLASPGRAARWGCSGRQLVVDRFGADAAARSCEAVYDEVLGVASASAAGAVRAGPGRRSHG